MATNQDFYGKSPDLYEEILAYESLDPYEGLLNRSNKSKRNEGEKVKPSTHRNIAENPWHHKNLTTG